MSEQAYEARRLRAVIGGAIDGAVMGIAIGCDLAHDEAVHALLDGLDAVPRAKYHNALSEVNFAGMGREKAEAEADRLRERAERAEVDAAEWRDLRERTAEAVFRVQRERGEARAEAERLRDLVEEFLEEHPSGEHWQATITLAEGGPAGWCAECMAEWPCLVERARVAVHAEDGDDDE